MVIGLSHDEQLIITLVARSRVVLLVSMITAMGYEYGYETVQH